MRIIITAFMSLTLMTVSANALDWANAPLACLPDRAEKWNTINEMEPCHCPPKDYCPPFIRAIDPENVVFYVTARNKVPEPDSSSGSDGDDSSSSDDSCDSDSSGGTTAGGPGSIPGGTDGGDGGVGTGGASSGGSGSSGGSSGSSGSSSGSSSSGCTSSGGSSSSDGSSSSSPAPDLRDAPYVFKFITFTADELPGFVGNKAVLRSVGDYSNAQIKQFIEPKIEELTGWDLDGQYFSYKFNYKINDFDPSAKIIDLPEEDLPMPRFYAQKCCVSDKAPKCPGGSTTGWTDGNNYGYTRYSYILRSYNKNYSAYGISYWVDSTSSPDKTWTLDEIQSIAEQYKITKLNAYHCKGYSSTTVTGREGCIVEGTPVILSDGNDVKIEELKVGDMLKSNKGEVKVIAINKFTQEEDTIFGINGEAAFISEEHPVLTTSGWKSVNPEITSVKSDMGSVGQLNIGDKIITVNGEVEIRTIDKVELESGATVYNLSIEGGEGFFANGMMVKDFNQVQIHY